MIARTPDLISTDCAPCAPIARKGSTRACCHQLCRGRAAAPAAVGAATKECVVPRNGRIFRHAIFSREWERISLRPLPVEEAHRVPCRMCDAASDPPACRAEARAPRELRAQFARFLGKANRGPFSYVFLPVQHVVLYRSALLSHAVLAPGLLVGSWLLRAYVLTTTAQHHLPVCGGEILALTAVSSSVPALCATTALPRDTCRTCRRSPLTRQHGPHGAASTILRPLACTAHEAPHKLEAAGEWLRVRAHAILSTPLHRHCMLHERHWLPSRASLLPPLGPGATGGEPMLGGRSIRPCEWGLVRSPSPS